MSDLREALDLNHQVARARRRKGVAVRVEPVPLTPEERRSLRLRRKHAAAQRTDADFLQIAKRLGSAHPFIVGCELAGVEPSEREVHRWRSGRGRALAAAWERWPKSKSLPRLAEPAAGFCTNCGERGAHFVPPSFGEPGFFICETGGAR